MEPVLHGWGLPGILIAKLGRTLAERKLTLKNLPFGRQKPKRARRLTMSVASSLIYFVSDACVTFLSGLIFYATQNYVFSLAPAVLLPAAREKT